jgi:hypothetical protein
MTEECLFDFTQEVLRHVAVDDRFRVSRPIVSREDEDVFHVFLDYCGGPHDHSTSVMEFRKSKMVEMGVSSSVEHIREVYLKAEAELVEFIS